jgi:hypothetical protein
VGTREYPSHRHGARVDQVQRPAGLMTWGAYQVADDDLGTWLCAPLGSTVGGINSAGERGWSYVGLPREPGLQVLLLVPGSGWWLTYVSVHSAEMVFWSYSAYGRMRRIGVGFTVR